MNCNETLTILRWFRPSENYNFWENFKKYFFCQIDIMIHFFYTKFIEESEYRIQFDKNSTQHLPYSFFWDLVFEKFVKNSWKFFSNTFIILSLQFELFLLFLRSHSFFPSTIVRGLCFPVNMHDMNVKIVQNKTKLVNERDCCCTNHLSTTD